MVWNFFSTSPYVNGSTALWAFFSNLFQLTSVSAFISLFIFLYCKQDYNPQLEEFLASSIPPLGLILLF